LERSRPLAMLFVFALAGGAAVVGYAAFRIWQQGETDERRRADAIVVLGAAHYEETPSAVFAARLDHAIALWHDGIAPYLVMTGGRAPGDVLSESEAARMYAIGRGVPADAILSEDQGRDTKASVAGVAAVLRAGDLRS